MSRLILVSLTCLAVLANLFVPHRIVSHNACCYGPDGRLLADKDMPCKEESNGPAISGPDCCAPRDCELRPAPASDTLVPDVVVPSHPNQHVDLPHAQALAGAVAVVALARPGPWGTGPPHLGGLLALHSRLNL